MRIGPEKKKILNILEKNSSKPNKKGILKIEYNYNIILSAFLKNILIILILQKMI